MSAVEHQRQQATRLRRVATFNPKPDLGQLNLDDPVSFVPMEAIGEQGDLDLSQERVAREIQNGYTYFEDGDVIRAKVTPCFENGKGAVALGLRNGRAFGTTELIVMRPHEDVDAKFLYYVTQSHEFRLQGESTIYGAHGVRRLSEDFVREYAAWLPPLPAQRAITGYLDRETARIDALAAAKRRMVRLLEDRKGPIRETAITAVRRSSPSVRLGHLAFEVDERLGGADPPVLLSVSIHHGVLPFAEVNPDRQARAEDLVNYKRCQSGDLILNRMRAFQGGLGCARQAGVVSPDYSVLRSLPNVVPDYLFHLMRSPWFVAQMEACLRGIGSSDQGNVRTPRVNWDDLKILPVPRPDEDDQKRLTERVARGLAATLAAQDAISRQIALLQERRQAIITAAVTGQREIPEAA